MGFDSRLADPEDKSGQQRRQKNPGGAARSAGAPACSRSGGSILAPSHMHEKQRQCHQGLLASRPAISWTELKSAPSRPHRGLQARGPMVSRPTLPILANISLADRPQNSFWDGPQKREIVDDAQAPPPVCSFVPTRQWPWEQGVAGIGGWANREKAERG